MTKTYALKRLLEHGQMTRAEMIECTRWPGRQVDSALSGLVQQGLVRRRGKSAYQRGQFYSAVMP